MKQHQQSNTPILSAKTFCTIFLGSSIKAASVPPTQPFMVWMKQSQANLHLGMLAVLKLTYERGVMTGWQIGSLREFVKGFSKFFGMTLANSIMPKEIEVSEDKKFNTLVGAACKGSFTALIEGPIGTAFNGWITYNITAKQGSSYLAHLGKDTVYGTLQAALKGNVLTSSRQVFSNTFIIGATEVLKEPLSEKFQNPLPDQFAQYNKDAQKLMVGGVIGILTAVVIAPTETVLTQILKAGQSEASTSSALRNIYTQYGLKAFCRGLPQKTVLIAAGSSITSVFQQCINPSSDRGRD